uniref:Leucine efflux protein LeuE n=1 Tax=uncultured Thiotrichaceae bacterium TaxID=298394 RepID=A0A6S6SN84_9GAMM|nr:MAG: Leucine efflux protein LeuE [uncultured Thiotrichaceae bacterium]
MESLGVLNYVTYLIGCILVILLPGPNSLYVLSLSAQQGVRVGWSAAGGIFLGDALLMLATALGAVSLLTTYPALFGLIKYAGAGYLAYLGFKMLSGAWQSLKNRDIHDFEDAPVLKKTSGASAFKKALLVSLLNPKAILFFLSFFVQFIDPGYDNPAIPFLVLGVTLQLCSFIYLATLIYAGNRLAETFRRRRTLSAVSGGSVGALFLAFATKLALASL